MANSMGVCMETVDSAALPADVAAATKIYAKLDSCVQSTRTNLCGSCVLVVVCKR